VFLAHAFSITEDRMNDEMQGKDTEAAEYEEPAVEDLDVTDGPAVTAAGTSRS
jgi:hypothetical protein